MFAVSQGKERLVRLLLFRGREDRNLRRNDGKTALQIAEDEAHGAIVQLPRDKLSN
jgi:ankyrin repeat protein